MSENTRSDTALTCPAADLDPKRVGEILLRVLPASAALGHQFPAGLKDYCHPRDEEMRFVIDMLSLPTPELAERWYGGVNNASRVASDGQRPLPSPEEMQCRGK